MENSARAQILEGLLRAAFPDGHFGGEPEMAKRNYLMVVHKTGGNRIIRLIRTPPMTLKDYGGELWPKIQKSLSKSLHDLVSQYKEPDYDIMLGQGEDIGVLARAEPFLRGWDDVTFEDLKY
jgi:hypothetical protein